MATPRKTTKKAAVKAKTKLAVSVNTEEITSWLDKLIARCKALWASLVKWFKS